ncbi:MAG TPA: hypothetical protein VD997_16890 [Phycisphaerales bacterium]|nr:hypothetical protein [Phycisphaerales bacterium]
MFARFSPKLGRVLTLKNTRKAGLIALPLIAATFIAPYALADGPRDDDRRSRSEDCWERNRDWRHRDNDWRGDWRDKDHDHHGGRGGGTIVIRPEIVIGRPSKPDVVVIEKHYPRRRVEVAPYEIAFKAYQSQDRIIVNIEGANRTSGFDIKLTSPEEGLIEMCNLAPADSCAQMITPFCLTASISACRPMHCVKVCVAGRTYTVPVTQSQSLS